MTVNYRQGTATSSAFPQPQALEPLLAESLPPKAQKAVVEMLSETTKIAFDIGFYEFCTFKSFEYSQ